LAYASLVWVTLDSAEKYAAALSLEERRSRWLVAKPPQLYSPARMTAAPMSAVLPRPGDIVGGKYLLDALIGQGGMGAVYRAKHRTTGGVRAIKIMLADTSNPEALQRFKNEARAAAEIQNEHVVRVDDVDEEMGYAFMVLEYLEGEDLAQLVDREGRLPPHVAVGYVLQALQGISQAHAMGIVHRDLKPSNLYLARRKDGTTTVKVLDFGISKSKNADALAQSPSALTSTKAMLGSPLYMSPEQLRSSKSVDQRADIWAIGIILYELLTRNVPFMGDNLGELFAAILETDPPPITNIAPEVPRELEAIVARCLQRNRDHRFQTAQELAQALAPYAVAGAGSVHAQGPMAGPLGGTAMLHPPQGRVTPSFGHQTPGTGPRMQAVTGSRPSVDAMTGSGPRAVGGTVALGMTPGSGQQLPNALAGGGRGTPQPYVQHAHAQTGNTWQSTGGGGDIVVPKSRLPVILLSFALFAGVIGVVLIWFFAVHSRPKTNDPTVASGSGSVTEPITPPSATIATSTTASSTPSTPSATIATTTTTTATTTGGPTSTAGAGTRPHGHTGPVVTKPPVTNEPATATAKPSPPPPPTPTKPPSTPTATAQPATTQTTR
jgi:hypothetical protein